MDKDNLIKVEVVYASKSEQCLLLIDVPRDSTVEQVIHLSGILIRFPEIDLHKQKIGIFSEIKQLSDIVNEGDRVEIYRPLLIDPKEARRARSKG